MTTEFKKSYVDKSNPSPYHLVVMQSQQMINNAFSNMWTRSLPKEKKKKEDADNDSDSSSSSDNEEDNEQASHLHNLDVEVAKRGTLHASLLAPEIIIHVTSSTPQLYYLVKFKSGTMKIRFTSQDVISKQKTFDVADWVVAFPVNIASLGLAKNDAKAAKYETDMGKPIGDFSLVQLYLDTSKTTSWEPSLSKFGTVVWADEGVYVRENFNKLVEEWISKMTNEKSNIIGVSLVAKEPRSVNSHAPSFPPTSCDYAPYPWIEPGTTNPPKDNQPANAIAMLLMTDKETPPSSIKLPCGPFVSDNENYEGTLCMKVTEFWDLWFLPLVQYVNFLTQIYPTTPYANAEEKTVSPAYHIAYNPKHPSPSDPYYQFKMLSYLGGPTCWWWSGDYLSSEAEDGDWWYKISVKQSSHNFSYVSFKDGGQKIQLSGGSTFSFKVYFTGASTGPSKTESSVELYTSWYLNFALGVVSDGGLQIARVDDANPACTTTYTQTSVGVNWKGGWDTFAKDISERTNNFFKNHLGQMYNNLQEDLKKEHKLFLPAGGTFLMKGAVFNRRGDLMASLTYNGAPAPTVAKKSLKSLKYLKSLPDRQALHPVLPLPIPSAPIQGPLFTLPSFSEELVGQDGDSQKPEGNFGIVQR